MVNTPSFMFDRTPKTPVFFTLTFYFVKRVRIRSYSGPHFPTFVLNTERYGVSVRIQSECGKMRTRTAPNMDTFHAVFVEAI